jgi:aminopeptidase N
MPDESEDTPGLFFDASYDGYRYGFCVYHNTNAGMAKIREHILKNKAEFKKIISKLGEVWNQFARSRTVALEVDALRSTRPIEYPVHSPDDANGMFDVLTYPKGGAILRMLEQYLGPDRFRDGIRRYLGKHAYGNTETHDLWDALEEETGEPVRRIMDAWIFQGGYPLISVTVADGSLRFAQRRYAPSLPDDATMWPVPLLIRQTAPDGRTATDAILVEAEGAALPLLDPEAVVVANAGGISFVRVWYDEALAARLSGDALVDLTPLERYALVDDSWAAVETGRGHGAAPRGGAEGGGPGRGGGDPGALRARDRRHGAGEERSAREDPRDQDPAVVEEDHSLELTHSK